MPEITIKFWRDPQGRTVIRAPVMSLTEELDRLEAENTRLRAALAAAEAHEPVPSTMCENLYAEVQRLKAALAAAEAAKSGPQGHGEPCYYCGKPCNCLIGDPGQWAIPLCHADDPGVVKWHHERCVSERLAAAEAAGPPNNIGDENESRLYVEGLAYDVDDVTYDFLRKVLLQDTHQ